MKVFCCLSLTKNTMFATSKILFSQHNYFWVCTMLIIYIIENSEYLASSRLMQQ